MRRLIAISALSLTAAFSGCVSSSSNDGSGSGIGNYQSCTADSQCPTGQGCDTEGGSLSPGYCTPLCDSDNQCPMGFDCPSGVKNQPGECDDIGSHSGRGICDQFDGPYGPTTCTGNGSGGSGGGGGHAPCSSDSQCPTGQGCDTEGGQLSPGYCTPLCDTDGQCPSGFDCPGMIPGQPGECDELGSHSGRGICDQFDGVNGPTTCGSGGSGTGGTGGGGGLPPGPVSSACQSCGLSNCSAEVSACTGDSTCQDCVFVDVSGPGCQTSSTVQALLACACNACASACSAYCEL
ncbi:MAG: hypothetical protein IPM35_15115 [Myxococcales bacterium]|nr:hypothetical protein [Myxococcales bacterium]